jgi:phage shock protein C
MLAAEGEYMKKLYLSSNDRKLTGVCAGIGEYFEIDSTLVRLGWIVMTVITGILPGIIAYIIAAIVIPEKPQPTSTAGETDASA